MIREGTYIAVADSWDFGLSANGNEFVSVSFKIREGEYINQFVKWNGYFTEKTTQRTLESLRYCGWSGNDVTDLTGLSKNLVQVVVTNEEYEEKTYSRVLWVNRLGGLAIKNQMTDVQKKDFARRMRGECLSVPASLAETHDRITVESKDAGLDVDNTNLDDIPF